MILARTILSPRGRVNVAKPHWRGGMLLSRATVVQAGSFPPRRIVHRLRLVLCDSPARESDTRTNNTLPSRESQCGEATLERGDASISRYRRASRKFSPSPHRPSPSARALRLSREGRVTRTDTVRGGSDYGGAISAALGSGLQTTATLRAGITAQTALVRSSASPRR